MNHTRHNLSLDPLAGKVAVDARRAIIRLAVATELHGPVTLGWLNGLVGKELGIVALRNLLYAARPWGWTRCQPIGSVVMVSATPGLIAYIKEASPMEWRVAVREVQGIKPE